MALNAARRDLMTKRAGHAPANQPQLDAALEKIRRTLEFPTAAADGQAPHDVAVHFDSPADFDPQKFQAAVAALQTLLETEER